MYISRKNIYGKSSNQDIDKNVKTEHSKRNSGKQTPAVALYQCTECTALDGAFKKIWQQASYKPSLDWGAPERCEMTVWETVIWLLEDH